MSSTRDPPRHAIRVIGIAMTTLFLILSMTGTNTVTALSSLPDLTTNGNTIAITHAGGRMGKILALTLQEDAELRSRRGNQQEGTDVEEICGLPKIRAICRSNEEAYSVRCDLGGMKITGESATSKDAKPIHLDWLETVVIESGMDHDARAKLLRDAFEGCRAAVLCDASHNELVWKEEIDEGSLTDTSRFSIIVPASENEDLSKRLLEEIDAASHSTTLRHVVLRSTMGLAVSDGDSKDGDFDGEGMDCDAIASAMGGEAALAGPREAERFFRQIVKDKTARNKRLHTILRLGALTDDPGMVPLVFGRGDDSILIKTTDDGTQNNRPPILSRSDAARISTFLIQNYDDNDNDDDDWYIGDEPTVIECAWHPKYGRDSVGREETISAAGRQDLKKDIQKALRSPSKTVKVA